MIYKGFSHLKKLDKSELSHIEFNEDIVQEIKKVRNKYFIKDCIGVIIIFIIIVNIFSLISFDGLGSYLACVPFLSVFLLLVFQTVIPLIRLNPSRIKYSGFYKVVGRDERSFRIKTNKVGYNCMLYAIDSRTYKKLPRVEVHGVHIGEIEFDKEYLFVSTNGRTFYLIPFKRDRFYGTTHVNDYSYDYKDSCYSSYNNCDDLSDLVDNSEVDVSNFHIITDSEFSKLDSDELLNVDLDAYTRFKSYKVKSFKFDLFVPLITLFSFIVIIAFLVFASISSGSLDLRTIIILVLVFLFVSFICVAITMGTVKNYKEDKRINETGYNLKYANVVKIHRSVSYNRLVLRLGLVTDEGFYFPSVICPTLDIYDPVEVNDRFIVISATDGLYCSPNTDSYNKILSRRKVS